MRDAFIAELHALAAEDPRVLLLCGDIGFKVFDKFRASYPDRFFNLGIAEQNMVGMSAGLAFEGKRPFVYTIIPFLTMRPFEQIRVDLCMHELPVRLVGVGGGLAYDILGPTHHSIEDVAILRSLPNMTVIVPSDPGESRQLTRASHALKGPSYVRLGKNGEPPLGSSETPVIGKAITLRPGDTAAVIGCGPVLGAAVQAHDLLKAEGVNLRVINMHTVKPLDREAVLAAARDCQAVVSLEEHSILGGLGSAVAEVLAESGAGVPFLRLGVKDRFTTTVGKHAHLLAEHGLTAENIAATVQGLLRAKTRERATVS